MTLGKAQLGSSETCCHKERSVVWYRALPLPSVFPSQAVPSQPDVEVSSLPAVHGPLQPCLAWAMGTSDVQHRH